MQGVIFELTDKEKELAVKYVEESGLFKNRLADYLGVSRPTIYRILEEDTDFFTRLKRADAIFCKNVIETVRKKDPLFILKTRLKEEFS